MRHGRPDFTGAPKITAHEMEAWIRNYDASNIGRDQPPDAVRLQTSKVLLVLSSPLPRALSSVERLGLKPDRVDDVFSEAELPVFLVPVIKLSPFSWAILYRLLWLCGLSKKAESLAMAKIRARRAADILIKHACDHMHPVLLMGHGVMNQLIASELKSLGWKRRTRAGKGYWGVAVFNVDSL